MLSAFAFNWLSILVFIIPFTFWGMISIRDIKNIYYLRKGRKNYEKLLHAPSSPSSDPDGGESIRDSSFDDDDKNKPTDGAFYSPGYVD